MRAGITVFTMLVGASAFGCGGAATGTGGLGGSAATSTGASGARGSGGNDSGPPPGCIPSEDPTTPVGADCGVFVDMAGDDANSGAQDKPVQTLKHAIELAAGEKAIYACAGATPFSEAITVPAGTVIYGGLECATWKFVGDTTKTEITADAGKIPVTLAMGRGTKLHDLYVLAAAAVDPSGSSIAVVADHVTADIDACLFEAGDAHDGAQGEAYPSSRKQA